MLGAHVRGALAADESAIVTSHLDGCESCREAVIAAVRADTRLAHGTPSLPTVPLRPREAPLAIGTRIGRYELRTLLGAGGMGRVYEAHDTELDRAIALKVLRPELAGALGVTERLARESRLMAKIAHPAVITVYDVGRAGDIVYIAMELVRGETLAAYVARVRPSDREVLALFEQAGAGLAAAHAAGIVHRDFKPDNVLVERGGKRAVVTDFGIARAAASDDVVSDEAPAGDVRITATGVAVGTPAYMAPEQLAGKPVDVRADVFAFSASLWEALFGERPFPGDTVAAIRSAYTRPPKPTKRVPFQLVATLQRGLAIDPDTRWPELAAMLAKLRRIRALRPALVRTALAVTLVAAGITGARVLTRSAADDDACARRLDVFATAYNPVRAFALRGVLHGDERGDIMPRLDAVASGWRAAQVLTCHGASTIAAANMSACLEARRLEVAGFVDDILADGPRYAVSLGGIVGNPVQCMHPAAGLLTPHVPEDPALRRRVTQLRYKLFDAEAARDRADYATAMDIGTKYADATKQWPPLQAEMLYMLGTAQNQGGDNKQSIATLREVATLAEAHHYDFLAANAWVQLSLATTQDEGDDRRGLEYIAYADAALDRIGRPGDVEIMVDYSKGVALANMGKLDEAEAMMKRAVELAETAYPQWLAQVIQGMGYVYEDRGRYKEAVAAYETALAHLPRNGTAAVETEIVMHERLAIALANIGRIADGVRHAEHALELADRTTGPHNMDRPVARIQLALVLQGAAQTERALAETKQALAELAAGLGERNERYGETLELEASLVDDLGRHDEALALVTRGCEILAFTTHDDSPQYAQCLVDEATVLQILHRPVEGLALVDKAVKILEPNGDLITAYAMRGALHEDLGHMADAQRDLERAKQLVEQVTTESGRIASIDYELAKVLWQRDPPRARDLLETALREFDTAIPNWKHQHVEALAWRASHR